MWQNCRYINKKKSTKADKITYYNKTIGWMGTFDQLCFLNSCGVTKRWPLTVLWDGECHES